MIWKLCFVGIICIALILGACGGADEPPSETNGNEAAQITTPSPIATAPPPAPTPTIAEAITHPPPAPIGLRPRWEIFPANCEPSVLVYQNALFGVKFSIEHCCAWNFEEFKNGSGVFLFHESGDWFHHIVTFQFGSISAGHPRDLRSVYGRPNMLPFAGGYGIWAHPDEPCDVFVTDNGKTVVVYTHIFYSHHDRVNRNILFLFRRDGRDYRDFEGVQMLYHAFLTVLDGREQYYLPHARAVINSLQFHDGAAMGLDPSPTAAEIGLSRYNIPRIDASIVFRIAQRYMLHALFEPNDTGHWAGPWRPYFWMGRNSGALPAISHLINGEVDLIFIPAPCADGRAIIEAAEAELEFIPIATDALIFITNKDNHVYNITIDQIMEIFTSPEIMNWADLGGEYGGIIPQVHIGRDDARKMLEAMISPNVFPHPDLFATIWDTFDNLNWPDFQGQFWIQHAPPNNFGLTFASYFTMRQEIAQGWIDPDFATLTINGIAPTPESILSGQYPLVTTFYAVILANSPADSLERGIIDWLLSPDGQDILRAGSFGGIL